MITHPTATELMQALAGVETGQVGDPRAVFLARVAENARATLDREAALGPEAEAAETARLRDLLGMDGNFAGLNAEFCARLANGRLSPLAPKVLAHLRTSVIDQIAIDQPAYSGLAALAGQAPAS